MAKKKMNFRATNLLFSYSVFTEYKKIFFFIYLTYLIRLLNSAKTIFNKSLIRENSVLSLLKNLQSGEGSRCLRRAYISNRPINMRPDFVLRWKIRSYLAG